MFLKLCSYTSNESTSQKLAEILSFTISTNLGGNSTLNFFANMPEVKYVEILQQISYE